MKMSEMQNNYNSWEKCQTLKSKEKRQKGEHKFCNKAEVQSMLCNNKINIFLKKMLVNFRY